MIAIVAELQLYVPGATSLKEKRKSLRAIIDAFQKQRDVAIAEVEHHDLHQRAGLAVAIVGQPVAHVRQRFDKLMIEVNKRHDVVVLDVYKQETNPRDE